MRRVNPAPQIAITQQLGIPFAAKRRASKARLSYLFPFKPTQNPRPRTPEKTHDARVMAHITSRPRRSRRTARHSSDEFGPFDETEWSFILPTKQAPVRPAQQAAGSL